MHDVGPVALVVRITGRRGAGVHGGDAAGKVRYLPILSIHPLILTTRCTASSRGATLRDLFCLLPSWSSKRVLELAPAYWPQTVQDPEVQQRLEANVYRRILLADPAEFITPATAAA